MIKTFAVNLTNLQAVEALNAIQVVGQTNGKNREMALKSARIGLVWDAKVRIDAI